MLKYTNTLTWAAILLIILSLVGKGLGLVREILLAGYFGAGREIETYLVGAVLPLLINTVIFYIAQNYFIPAYNDVKSSNPINRKTFTSDLLWTFLGIGILIAVVLWYFSHPIMASYMEGNEGEYEKAREVFILLLPGIPINAAFSVLSAYLNAEFRYSHPAFSQLFWNLGQIVLIILLHEQLNIYVLPVSIVAGYILQLGYIYAVSRDIISYDFKPSRLKSHKLSGGYTLVFIIIIEFLNQLYTVFDRYYYGEVEQGGIAALNYATTLFQMPISIISLGIATVVFPKFSAFFATKQFENFNRVYKKSLLYGFIIYTPIVIFFILFGDWLIRIFLERGKFSSYNTGQTFDILRIFSISLIFYASYAVINKVILSTGLVKQLLLISIASLLIKIALNAALVGFYKQNGLAVSSTVSYIFMSISGFLLVRSKVKHLSNQVIKRAAVDY